MATIRNFFSQRLPIILQSFVGGPIAILLMLILGVAIDAGIHRLFPTFGGLSLSIWLPFITFIAAIIILATAFGGKAVGRILTLVIVLAVATIALLAFKGRYPLINYASDTREKQTELDIARGVLAEFADVNVKVFGSDTLMMKEVAVGYDSVMRVSGRNAALNYYEKMVDEYIPYKEKRKRIEKKLKDSDKDIVQVNNQSIDNPEIIRVPPGGGAASSRNIFRNGDNYKVLEMEGIFLENDEKKIGNNLNNTIPLKVGGNGYNVVVKDIPNGPLTFYSPTGGWIKIYKY